MNRRDFFKRSAGTVVAAAIAPEAIKAVVPRAGYDATTHTSYGLGFSVTDQMLEDDSYSVTYRYYTGAGEPIIVAPRRK